jgi:hypothetical protein
MRAQTTAMIRLIHNSGATFSKPHARRIVRFKHAAMLLHGFLKKLIA